ncbi:MAG: two pore domain potassium channel family protein [Thermoleophilia bacterium]|nr:two pore domain potassium channel family protein [Thermoleophilia bacterium]
MAWVISAAGVGLVFIGLREIFHTLFHPTGEGWLTRAVVGATWRLVKRIDRRRSLLVLAGPLGMVSVIVVWAGLLGIGFALVVWPHLETDFVFQNLDPAAHSGFVDALYFSFVTLATLGYGEITPATSLFRVVTPIEAIVGFILLTAVISWVLSIYPALTRLRRLAVAVNTFVEARERVPDASAAHMFHDFADRTLEVRMDFVHHPVIYFFHAPDLRSSLPAALPVLRRLALEYEAAVDADERLAATTVRIAVDDLAHAIGRDFLGHAEIEPARALAAYAVDHTVDIDDEQVDRKQVPA